MRALIAALCLLPVPALGNDGFGGLSATGLHFAQTDAVAMEEEDLSISPDRIEVAYVFRNLTEADVTGEVIFPLPPVALGSLEYSNWNLPEDLGDPDLVQFTASVEGAPVAVSLNQIAVIEPEWQDGRPIAQQYDTPGQDVTDDLAAWDIPLTLDLAVVKARLLAMPQAERAGLTAAGLADFIPADPANGTPEDAYPKWSLITRYHWSQTFPAGETLRIAHGYDNRPSGGIFVWQHPPTEDWNKELAAQYCIDDATSKGIVKRFRRADSPDTVGMAYMIDYVLRTANSWAGPIGRFRLTLDKGSDRNIVSVCANGIKKVGPTTFVWEKTDFTPEDDLAILIVQPME